MGRVTHPRAIREPLNQLGWPAERHHRVRARSPLMPSPCFPVCRRLLEQVVSCGGLLPGAGIPEEQTVTWFQFHSYLRRQSVSDLEKHFAQLTKEGRSWHGGAGGLKAACTNKGRVRPGACLGSGKPAFPNHRDSPPAVLLMTNFIRLHIQPT